MTRRLRWQLQLLLPPSPVLQEIGEKLYRAPVALEYLEVLEFFLDLSRRLPIIIRETEQKKYLFDGHFNIVVAPASLFFHTYIGCQEVARSDDILRDPFLSSFF
jgi:hypothetical protein